MMETKPKTIRLNQSKRGVIFSWMCEQYKAKVDKTALNKALAGSVACANEIILARYPEQDMLVLRKYKCTRKDRCLRFQDSEGVFFGVDFGFEDSEKLNDMPNISGCVSREAFPCTVEQREILQLAEKEQHKLTVEATVKNREYTSFVAACRTLQDVEKVIPLPADLRKKLGAENTALSTLSEEAITAIKNDFAESKS